MPSMVDEHGIEVSPEGEIILSDESIERFVDMLIAKLKHRGVTVRDLAKILNRSKSVIQRRYEGMPREARDYYVALQLG